MMRIAITGIIGSGKSEVIKYLVNLGAKVCSADIINAELLSMPFYQQQLAVIFPNAIDNGVVNKAKIARAIFTDDTKREALNSLAHPLIIEKMDNLTDGENLIFCEVPLLNIESAKMFDRIWYVECTKSNRLKRIMQRNDVDKEYAMLMLQSQDNNDIIMELATDIIHNDGDMVHLKSIVEARYWGLKK